MVSNYGARLGFSHDTFRFSPEGARQAKLPTGDIPDGGNSRPGTFPTRGRLPTGDIPDGGNSRPGTFPTRGTPDKGYSAPRWLRSTRCKHQYPNPNNTQTNPKRS